MTSLVYTIWGGGGLGGGAEVHAGLAYGVELFSVNVPCLDRPDLPNLPKVGPIDLPNLPKLPSLGVRMMVARTRWMVTAPTQMTVYASAAFGRCEIADGTVRVWASVPWRLGSFDSGWLRRSFDLSTLAGVGWVRGVRDSIFVIAEDGSSIRLSKGRAECLFADAGVEAKEISRSELRRLRSTDA